MQPPETGVRASCRKGCCTSSPSGVFHSMTSTLARQVCLAILLASPACAGGRPRSVERQVPAPPKAKRVPHIEKAALEFPSLKSDEDLAAVTSALNGAPGVASAIVDGRTGLAVVDYDSGRTRLERLLTACRDAGFEAHEYRVEERFP